MPAPPLIDPPVTFARLSGTTSAGTGALDASVPAVGAGVTGLDVDVVTTADGVAVVGADHLRRRLTRVAIRSLDLVELPSTIPPLWVLVASVPDHVQLLVRVTDGASAAAVVAVADEAGAASRLWLCGADLDEVSSWAGLRRRGCRLLQITRRRSMPGGAERHAAEVAHRGLDGLVLPHQEWSGGVTTLVHRFGLLAVAEGGRFGRDLALARAAGVDALSSSAVDVLVAAGRPREDPLRGARDD